MSTLNCSSSDNTKIQQSLVISHLCLIRKDQVVPIRLTVKREWLELLCNGSLITTSAKPCKQPRLRMTLKHAASNAGQHWNTYTHTKNELLTIRVLTWCCLCSYLDSANLYTTCWRCGLIKCIEFEGWQLPVIPSYHVSLPYSCSKPIEPCVFYMNLNFLQILWVLPYWTATEGIKFDIDFRTIKQISIKPFPFTWIVWVCTVIMKDPMKRNFKALNLLEDAYQGLGIADWSTKLHWNF